MAVKPRIVASRCLEFDHCRYNGEIIRSETVKALKPFVEFQPICPELEIGLDVPRDPIRVVSSKKKLRLVQPATGQDFTGAMQDFADAFIDSLRDIDGFILKGRSPSCGTKEVKLFSAKSESGPSGLTRGFFGGAVMDRFPLAAIEEEGRLLNFRLREHFLMRVFTMARFRETFRDGRPGTLVQFHAEHKFLLMACSQTELHSMGRLVANIERRPMIRVLTDYQQRLVKAMSRPLRPQAAINVLMHAAGHFKKGLSSTEKSFFSRTLTDYRAGKVPLSVPNSIIKSWIVRFNEGYLAQQRFFSPYPDELITITDSGKGRDL